MQAQRLGDLAADGVQRVQRRHRLLEHHADAVAAQRAQRGVVERRQLAGRRSGSSPLTCAPSGSRPISASAVIDLPQPDSPISPSVCAAVERERHAAQRRQAGPCAVGKRDAQVAPPRAAARSCGAPAGRGRRRRRAATRPCPVAPSALRRCARLRSASWPSRSTTSSSMQSPRPLDAVEVDARRRRPAAASAPCARGRSRPVRASAPRAARPGRGGRAHVVRHLGPASSARW